MEKAIRYFLILTLSFLSLTNANCEVKEIIIVSRDTVDVYNKSGKYVPYEVIKGMVIFEISPGNQYNKIINDLELAGLNENGKVEFSSDFELHKPVFPLEGNRRLICFVPNRSTKMGEGIFNYMTGINWLYSNGWSYLWCGWNCDVPQDENVLNIRVPVLTKEGNEIHGKVYSEIISYSNDTVKSMPLVWGGSIAYEPVRESIAEAELYCRQYRDSEPYEINRSDWDFGEWVKGELIPNPRQIYLEQGFKPGWLYELVYEAKNPELTGAGMAAIRDLVSFMKFEEYDNTGKLNPLAGSIDYTYAWGHSQSARLLNHFVHDNFNADEKGRKVIDGILASCPGAGRGLFNSRFAQFTRHGSHHEDNLYPVDVFPFTSVFQTDPDSNKSGSAYEKAKSSGTRPRIMILNSSTDYWTRGASLLHTDVSGVSDLDIDEDVRIYMASGMTHTDSRMAFLERALLVALDRWVSSGIMPPDSEVPKISDGSLVSLDEWKQNFPAVPGLRIPDSYYRPLRLDPGKRWEKDGIADIVPPLVSGYYNALIPQVDVDGNDIAGIKLPEVKVPIASNCGWELRDPGFSNTLKRNSGKDWLFCLSEEERIKKEDPRKSIYERYPEKNVYIREYEEALNELRNRKLLLDEDVDILSNEAGWIPLWIDTSSVTLQISKISCSPQLIRPGQKCKIRVELTDDSVKDIRAELREASFLNTQLKQLKQKGIWEGYITIPGDAPEGTFNFDISFLDKDLRIINRQNMVSDINPSVSFSIKHN